MRTELDRLRRVVLAHEPRSGGALAIPRLRVRLSRAPTAPTPVMFEPMLYIVLQGAKRLTVGERAIEYRGGSLVIMSLDLPATGEVIEATADEPYLALELVLDRTVVATLLLDSPGRPGADVEGFAVGALPSSLLDPLDRMVGLLDTPSDIPVLAPLIEREIIYRVFQSGGGAMLRQYAAPSSRLSQIGRVLERLRAEPAEPLRIEAMADLAGMSVSSFHRHFKAVTAMTPLAFHKSIRLLEARRLLLLEPGRTAHVAASVGYESASQFSRDYKRQFGASPARDAASRRA